jgi:hypothetical protein
MTLTHKNLTFAGLLLCLLILPQVSYGITGCTNANLMGDYNAQISNSGLMNVLNSMSNVTSTPGPTGTTPIPATANPGGFGNNPNSLTGKIPGLGRYFLDGNGNINGVQPGATGFIVIGKYSVNDDCTATMSLNTGATFNAIVAANGTRVLFIESDSAGGGAIGELDLATTACIAGEGGQKTFAFNVFGAQQASTPSSGTTPTASVASIFGTDLSSGMASHDTVPVSVAFQPTSVLGSITLDGQGSFSLSEWLFTGGSLKPVKATGTYTFGMNCNISLTFNQAASSTGSGGATPAAVQGILVTGSSGLLVFQTDQVAADTVTGQLVGQ